MTVDVQADRLAFGHCLLAVLFAFTLPLLGNQLGRVQLALKFFDPQSLLGAVLTQMFEFPLLQLAANRCERVSHDVCNE